jgi:ribonuclease T2
VNPRFSLALVALLLTAGAASLWWSDRVKPAVPATPPIATPAAAPVEVLPPAQDYVLAISWHAAFCETKPNLTECRGQRSGDYTATHFALHGLWPQDDDYCGVDQEIIDMDATNNWDELPAIEVSDATWRELVRVMPGTTEQLERHEWALHGTCADVSAERYFSRAIDFVEAFNRSAVRELFATNLGRRITSTDVRDAVDHVFGAGAGRKVRVDCEEDGSRDLVYELRINLYGEVMGGVGLADLIQDGRNISVGCHGGLVDRVGDQ